MFEVISDSSIIWGHNPYWEVDPMVNMQGWFFLFGLSATRVTLIMTFCHDELLANRAYRLLSWQNVTMKIGWDMSHTSESLRSGMIVRVLELIKEAAIFLPPEIAN